MSKCTSRMSWLLLIFVLSFTFNNMHSEANHDQKKLPSAVIVGSVYCDTCFQRGFSKTSHSISGASVAVECKDEDSNPSFYEEAKTYEHGEFKVHLPVSVTKHVKIIKACSVKLLRSSEPNCALASSATSPSPLTLKGKQDGTHIFSAGFSTLKPLKQPELCVQKPTLFPKKSTNSIKISVPGIPGIPKIPPIPGIPQIPAPVPVFPQIPSPNSVSEIPSPVSVPGIPQIPSPVSVPGIPQIPSPVSVPGIPQIPSPVSVPGIPQIPSPVSVSGIPQIPSPVSVPGIPQIPSPVSVPGIPQIPSPISVPGIPQIPTPISVPGVPQFPAPISVPPPPSNRITLPPLPPLPHLPDLPPLLPELPPLPLPPLPKLQQQQNPNNNNPLSKQEEKGQLPSSSSKALAFPTAPILPSPIPSIGRIPLLPPNPFQPPIFGIPSIPIPGLTPSPPSSSIFPPLIPTGIRVSGIPGFPGIPPASTSSASSSSSSARIP